MHRRRRPSDVELGIRGERVARGDHVAYLWETEEQFAEAVRFLSVGLERGDRCVVFGHDEANEKVLGILGSEGRDLEGLKRAGRLSVIGGDPDPERILHRIARDFDEAADRGAPLIRLLGNIGWGREGWPTDRETLEFEARVNEAARSYPAVVLCMYDVKALPGTIILHGAFETHPLTFCRNLLRENPHYVPFREFVSEVAEGD